MADNNSSDGNSTEITVTSDSNGMNTSPDGGVRYYKPVDLSQELFRNQRATIHTLGSYKFDHGQLILQWSVPKKQQYAISGTVAVGQTLTVAKSGDNDVADDTDYQWQSSSNPDDPDAWSDITGATSANYTITRSDRYMYLRVKAVGSMLIQNQQIQFILVLLF